MRLAQAALAFASFASAPDLLAVRTESGADDRSVAHSPCDIAGAWVLRGAPTPGRSGTYVATAFSGGLVDFSINWNIRHGPTEGNGTYVGSYGLNIQVADPYGQPAGHPVVYYQTGTFSKNCTAITWDPPSANWSAAANGTYRATGGDSRAWCKAWTAGCKSPPAPPPPVRVSPCITHNVHSSPYVLRTASNTVSIWCGGTARM